MSANPIFSRIGVAPKSGGFRMPGYHVWCGSTIQGEDGKFHMFASRWRSDRGYGWQWLFNCEIVRAVSDTPEGPYQFQEVVFQRRERHFFDGMNQHNPSIKFWKGTYYLFYFGTTYGGPVPETNADVTELRALETWNRKRIGLACSKSVYGPWQRPDRPLIEPRPPGSWDCTITTNPAAAILSNGNTYLIYKSREYAGSTLQLGVAFAEHPEGPYKRLSNDPIFKFANPDFHVEDPFLWYDDDDGKFHIVMKDDYKNNCGGITGEWGAGVYATSTDCIKWDIPDHPKAFTRLVKWDDGTESEQCNLERPHLLFQNGRPTHLFLATGNGKAPWEFQGETWNMVIPLTEN